MAKARVLLQATVKREAALCLLRSLVASLTTFKVPLTKTCISSSLRPWITNYLCMRCFSYKLLAAMPLGVTITDGC